MGRLAVPGNHDLVAIVVAFLRLLPANTAPCRILGEHPKYGQTKEQPCLFTQPPPSQLEPPLSEGRSYREAPQAELPQAADPLLARGSEHLLAVYRSARVG